jgi:hypothetical protein
MRILLHPTHKRIVPTQSFIDWVGYSEYIDYDNFRTDKDILKWAEEFGLENAFGPDVYIATVIENAYDITEIGDYAFVTLFIYADNNQELLPNVLYKYIPLPF